jgi:hypothetical protein
MSLAKTPQKIRNFLAFGLTPDQKEQFVVDCIEKSTLTVMRLRVKALLINNKIEITPDVEEWLGDQEKARNLANDICNFVYPSEMNITNWEGSLKNGKPRKVRDKNVEYLDKTKNNQ